jgi:2-amino-4-hydroxy-6-hydroxymethyldihydropteridine diphosphokinase
MSVTAYIALGSNLGDRHAYLDKAIQALNEQSEVEVKAVSSYYVTAPVGGPAGQGAYLNAAAELETDLPPDALLRILLEVERTLGRTRQESQGPRTIDLDLLIYGDVVRDQPELTIPHPRMHERLFVLQPLAEIAPQAVHPISGLTISQLLEKLRAQAPAPAACSPHGCELVGLCAVVTGSSSGIGLAIAMELGLAGANVIVHRRKPPAYTPPFLAATWSEQLEADASEIRKSGVRSRVILADLRNPDECRQFVQTAWDEWNGIDIWINNAGADILTGDIAQQSFEVKFQELLAVDVRATILLSRDVGQRMKARGSGVLLNMGWDQAETGMEGDSGQLFGTAKAAVMAFSKSLALTLAPQVRVNCLAPGWIQTRWGEQASERWQERVRRETPLGRWGKPEDVAATARWLVSPAAAFITGQVIRINGGAIR